MADVKDCVKKSIISAIISAIPRLARAIRDKWRANAPKRAAKKKARRAKWAKRREERKSR